MGKSRPISILLSELLDVENEICRADLGTEMVDCGSLPASQISNQRLLVQTRYIRAKKEAISKTTFRRFWAKLENPLL